MRSASFIPILTMRALALQIELGLHKDPPWSELFSVLVGDHPGPCWGPPWSEFVPCVGPIRLVGLRLTWSLWVENKHFTFHSNNINDLYYLQI